SNLRDGIAGRTWPSGDTPGEGWDHGLPAMVPGRQEHRLRLRADRRGQCGCLRRQYLGRFAAPGHAFSLARCDAELVARRPLDLLRLEPERLMAGVESPVGRRRRA